MRPVLAMIPPAAPAGDGDAVVSAVQLGVALVALTTVVGMATKIVRVPYTVALVVAGLGLAMFRSPVSHARLTESLVLMLLLPPLLFQAALGMDVRHLRRQWVAISLFAVPGVVLTMGAAALAIRFVLPHAVPPEHANWTTALVVGAIVAPTDPISVVFIFRSLGVPERLRVLVEGESLFNDGTAAALFSVLKASVAATALAAASGSAAQAADAPGAGSVLVEFLRVAGLGAVLGIGLGLVAFWLLRRLDDHTLETAITVSLAWGAYVLAERLQISGVIATVFAGLLIGNYGKNLAMAEATRVTLTGFWESLDFIVNSVVFLLVGLELGDPEIGGVGRLLEPNVLLGAGLVYAALLAARAVKVGLVARFGPERWPGAWNWILWWAGLRGGLCLALSLALPPGEMRAYVLSVVFLVVLATLFIQALTMSVVVRRALARAEGAD